MPPFSIDQFQAQAEHKAATEINRQASTTSEEEGFNFTPSDYLPRKGESLEDWNKRAVMTYGSAVASATCSAAFPPAAPLCMVMGPVMVQALIWVSDGIRALVTTVLPNSWTAQGVFDATIEAPRDFEVHEDPFNPSPLVGGPLKSWQDAIGQLDQIWAEACAQAGLAAPVPMRVPLAALQAPDRIEDHPDLLEVAGAPHLPQAVRDRGYAETSEECLLAWLDSYASGWRHHVGVSYDSDDTEGKAYVYTSKLPGSVTSTDAWGFEPAPWGWGQQSRGPFGLHVYGWPDRCNDGCKTKFFNARNACWKSRLFALAVAVQPVAWAMVESVDRETRVMSGKVSLKPGDGVNAVQRRANGEGVGAGTVLLATGSVAALGLLAWRSWAHWRGGKPFWSWR